MHIAVFGASGSVGRQVVAQAQARGHEVTAFGRDRGRLPDTGPAGRVVEGDVFVPEQAAEALRGADAVVISLGAAPADRSRVRTRGTASILRAMAAEGVERLVCTSCLGTGASYAPQSWFTRRIVLDLWLWRVVSDHEAQEALIAQSDLRWTVVRPPHLTDRPHPAVQTFPAEAAAPASSVGRAELAGFLLDTLEQDRFVKEHVGVCATS